MTKKKKTIGCPQAAKREAARKRAAQAVAEWLTEDEIRLLCEALETAVDDSYEWSKHSDEGDDRREHESGMLSRILSVANASLCYLPPKTTATATKE
jgi:hypothetical protein